MDVVSNLKAIQTNIEKACEKNNREKDEITVIGVTKYVTIERTQEAIQAGITHLGENRTDEFLRKYESLNDENVKWHFIGSLQSRKVKDIIHEVEAIHSLDRMSLAKEIEKRAQKETDCFVQVNVSGEESKHGIHPDDVLKFVKEVSQFSKVRIVGLMTMAPHIDNEDKLRQVFRNLANLRDQIKQAKLSHAPCEYLSMGMSNDYQIAIEEGATHIRLGSDLVGPYEK